MAGTWWTVKDGHGVEEMWLPGKDGTMLGVSRSTRQGATVREEYMRIGDWDGKMSLALVHKLGEPADVYPAIEMTENQALFGRPDDVRQLRIRYTPTDRGLFAVISGIRNGTPYKMEFDFEPDKSAAKKFAEMKDKAFGIKR